MGPTHRSREKPRVPRQVTVMVMPSLFLAIAAASQAIGPGAQAVPDVRCGSYCLYIALKAAGLDPRLSSFADLEKSLGPPGSGGYPLAALADEAAQRGGHPLAVETSVDSLRLRKEWGEKFACIALLEQGHFVLLYDVDDQYAYIVDYPKDFRVPIGTLEGAWTGKCLLIGATPLRSEELVVQPWYTRVRPLLACGVGVLLLVLTLAVPCARLRSKRAARLRCAAWFLVASFAASGSLPGCGVGAPRPAESGITATNEVRGRQDNPAPALEIAPPRHELGVIHVAGQTGPVSVKSLLRNRTEGELRVREIKKSCLCTSLELDSDRIPPGGTSVLTVTIDPGVTSSERQTGLEIVTDEPSLLRPYAVTFHWTTVSTLAADPREVRGSRWNAAEEAHSDVALILTDCSLCSACGITAIAASKQADCSFEWSRDVEMPGHDHDPGHAEGVRIGTLRIQPLTNPSVGEHGDIIYAKLVCGETERAQVTIPISWVIAPALQVAPPRVSLGLCRPADQVRRSLLLRSTDGSPLRVEDIDSSEADTLLESSASQSDPSMAKISLVFRVPDQARDVWKGHLTIKTNHPEARVIHVPFSGLLETN